MDERVFNDEPNDTNVIEKLKFCKIDSDGQIKLEQRVSTANEAYSLMFKS